MRAAPVPAVLLGLALLAGCQCGPETRRDAGVDAGLCAEVRWEPPEGCDAGDLEGQLACVPGLHFTKGTTTVPNAVRYDLTLDQPVDHEDPGAGRFAQRASLLVVDPSMPVVLLTSGYNLVTGRTELTRTFGTNQLSYEHRYFSASRPVPTDWTKLTIRQAADDAHDLVHALRWMFPGRWVNTGGSKGGMTSLYQRRFHPCDVDATVAYVAPVTWGLHDPAYNDFLASVGGPDWASCREALGAFQRRLLLARATLVPMMPGTYTILGADKVFELAVVELNFAFWQYTAPGNPDHGCSAIPGVTATPREMLDFLLYHSSPEDLGSDDALQFYAPYYYQAATQLGGAAPYEAPIADLLAYPGADVVENFVVPGIPLPAYDANAMVDVDDWLAEHGERVMLIYGEFDPWSTHRIPIGAAADSYEYLAPGDNHHARLGSLAPADKTAALGTVERWLGVPVVATPFERTAGEPQVRWPR